MIIFSFYVFIFVVGTVISVIIFYIALDDFRSGFAAQWVSHYSEDNALK